MRRQPSFAAVLVGRSVLIREGLAEILHSAKFRILSSVSSADDVPPPGKPLRHPTLFLIVHIGGDDFDVTLEQIKILRGRCPDGRIAVVADRYRLSELVSAFRAGANGYLVNIITCDRFIKSVELVIMGETIVPQAFLSSVLGSEGRRLEAAPNEENGGTIHITMEDAIAPPLSPREKSILRYLINGDSNKCIARKIDITEATVKVHVKAILRKIRVQNRTQAAIWGMNNGSLTRPENDSAPPLIPDNSNGLADPVNVIQIERLRHPHH